MSNVERLKLSVHRVVDTILRSGDIDSRYVEDTVMQQGAAAHRRLQKDMGDDYRREVPLQLETEAGGVPIRLYGRADGVFTDGEGQLCLEEIKTTTLPLDRLDRQRDWHLGQAKCYAVMLLRTMAEPPETITVQLTYYQLETEEVQRRRFPFTAQELDAFLEDLLTRYGAWIRFEREWAALRDESIAALGFPYPAYRKGQRELAAAVYRTIAAEKRLYAQAPTGIGKTLSTLFPAIKALGEHKADKLFYLTAKTVTRTVAEEAAALLRDKGLRLKSVTLRAKDKTCLCEETVCNPDYCPYARGHYDRVNDALYDLMTHHDGITPAQVEACARAHTVCPYELALDATLRAELVIGDYNHVFDPTVYLRRFFDGEGGGYVFLIDEAHNLADRVRDMYSASLRKGDFSRLPRTVPDKNRAAAALRRTARSVNRHLLDTARALGGQKAASRPAADTALNALVALFCRAAEEWLGQEQNSGHEGFREVLDLYFEARAYQTMADLYNERFTTLLETEDGGVTVTQFCLDPSAIIGDKLGLAKAAVLFSATLTPLPYYREVLGGREGDPFIALPSPFDEGRLLLAAHTGISTKYADREASYTPVAQALYTATSYKKGNYLAFFPSYRYMDEVYARFTAAHPEVDTRIQQGHMDEEERAAFLACFDADNANTLVGFCVLGGIFSEGIDLKGDRLIGSIVVGVGLPGISLRQEEIRAYYNRVNGGGYAYAYMFPGMNKVMQAAGRVIRTAADTGLVLLIDSRFGTAAYRALYPAHWSQLHILRRTDELCRLLEAFPYFRE